MHLYKRIDLMNNRNLIFGLNVLAVIAFLGFLWLFGMMAGSFTFSLNETDLAWLLVAILVMNTLHEVIHGLFYKIFKPNGKIKFGFKNGLLFVTSPKSLYTKRQFAWIGASPFILITLILMGLFYAGIINPGFFVIIGALHSAGCVGDFYLLWVIVRTPRHYFVCDTQSGMDIYSQS